MTHEDALTQARQLKEACPELVVMVWLAKHPHEYSVRVLEPFAAEWAATLPDALSVQAYLDAKQGYRAVLGVADFGASGL